MEVETSTNQINLDYLEVTFGNNKMIIHKILDSFLNKTPEMIKELSENAKENNWDEVKMIAHKAKSSFNIIGAKNVGAVLQKVELESTKEAKPTIHALIDEVITLGEQCFNEIKKEINN